MKALLPQCSGAGRHDNWDYLMTYPKGQKVKAFPGHRSIKTALNCSSLQSGFGQTARI